VGRRQSQLHLCDYAIVSGPLPVANYRSTISVMPDGKGSALKWSGTYDAKGTSDDQARTTINGIYEAGAKSLAGG
jgi:hypothetical protein